MRKLSTVSRGNCGQAVTVSGKYQKLYLLFEKREDYKMKYNGTVSLNTEPLTVWDVVLDVDRFAACMPGVENLKKLDDRTLRGKCEPKSDRCLATSASKHKSLIVIRQPAYGQLLKEQTRSPTVR